MSRSAPLPRTADSGDQQRRQGHEPEHGQPDEERGAIGTARRLLAELLGTFALTFVAAGGEVFAALSDGHVGYAARAVAPGLTVLALIYAIGDVSGAHFNPAVTLAFALRGAFPWRRAPGYWAAELGGALLAAGLLRLAFGNVADLGATLPKRGIGPVFLLETVLTWLLISVILGTATRYRLIGPNAAIAVGATIALDGLIAGPISGASMNPARSLGPALVSGHLENAWLYVVAPLLGATLAVLMARALHGPVRENDEDRAARGDGGGNTA